MEQVGHACRFASEGLIAITSASPKTERPKGLQLPVVPARMRVVVGVAVVLLGLGAVVSHALEYRGDERFSKDFALDYSSAKAFLDGANPYAPIRELVGRYLDPPPEVLERNILPGANWHTPAKLLVTVPLTALPYRAAGVVWLLISAATLVAAGRLFAAELGATRAASWVAGAALLAVPVVQIDLSAGQLNGPMLLLMVLAWRYVRRGRDLLAGLALGGAVALKFFPAFMALPLLAQRKFRAVGAAAAFSILLTLAGAAFLGPEETRAFLEAGRGGEGFDYWDAAPANVAWWGIATRWLVPNGWVDAGIDARGLGIALAIVGMVVWVLAAATPRARLSRDAFWAAAPLMLLAWPISWIHYLTLALPWVILSAREVSRRGGPLLLASFGIVGILMLMGFPPGAPAAEVATPSDIAVLYQLPTYALLGAVAFDRFLRPARAPDA